MDLRIPIKADSCRINCALEPPVDSYFSARCLGKPLKSQWKFWGYEAVI